MSTLIPLLKILCFLLVVSIILSFCWNNSIWIILPILKIDWLFLYLILIVIDAINIIKQLEEIKDYL